MSSNDKWLMLETSALNFLQRPIYVIKSVDNTKLPCTIHLCSFVARSAWTWVQCANCWVTTSVHENSLEKERLTLQYSPLGNLSVRHFITRSLLPLQNLVYMSFIAHHKKPLLMEQRFQFHLAAYTVN